MGHSIPHQHKIDMTSSDFCAIRYTQRVYWKTMPYQILAHFNDYLWRYDHLNDDRKLFLQFRGQYKTSLAVTALAYEVTVYFI